MSMENELALNANEIRLIPLDQIEPNKNQIRKEFKKEALDQLATSIQTQGLKFPILITSGENGKYRIVDGERRWRAQKLLAEKNTTITSIKAIYQEKEDPIDGMIANLARSDYNPMETADAYQFIREHLGENTSDEEVGAVVGKSRSLVAEYKSLLTLPKEIQEKARHNSCVPFRRLKTIAASKQSDEQKIDFYEELHKKYSQEKPAPGTAKHNKATRSVISVRKKVLTMKDSLNKLVLDGVEDLERDEFLKSLKATVEAAQRLLKEYA